MFIWFLLSSSFFSIVSVSPLLIHLSSFLHLPSVFTQHWKGEVGMSMLEQDCAKDFAWRLSPSLFDFSSFLLRTKLLFSGTITTSSLTSLTCFTVWLQLHHTVNMWTVNAVMVDFMVTSAPFLSPHLTDLNLSLVSPITCHPWQVIGVIYSAVWHMEQDSGLAAHGYAFLSCVELH